MKVQTRKKVGIDGLWVLLVDNAGQVDLADHQGRVPMMARAGNDETYVLGFKNMSKARDFVKTSQLEDVEPRMVVQANRSEYLRIAESFGASGVLVDYDPHTHEYASASELC